MQAAAESIVSTGLEETQQLVPQISALIERQRELVEELYRHGQDVTSAKIVYDSLLVTLSLYVQLRHRLREIAIVETQNKRGLIF